MNTFTDNKGDQWTIHLTLTKVRKIAVKFGLDVMDPNGFNSLMQSLGVRAAYAYAAIEEQAKERGVSEDEFEMRLQGEDVLDKMSDCLLQECSDFFLRFGQTAMSRLATTSINLMKRGRDYVNTQKFQDALNEEAARVFSDGNESSS